MEQICFRFNVVIQLWNLWHNVIYRIVLEISPTRVVNYKKASTLNKREGLFYEILN